MYLIGRNQKCLLIYILSCLGSFLHVQDCNTMKKSPNTINKSYIFICPKTTDFAIYLNDMLNALKCSILKKEKQQQHS